MASKHGDLMNFSAFHDAVTWDVMIRNANPLQC